MRLHSKQSGLYLHIPYCLHKCGYCDFNSHKINTEEMDQYVEALIREMHGGRLYGGRFGDRMRGHGPLAEQIAGTFRVFAARYGLSRTLPPPSSSAFCRPGDAAQMRLFDAA